MLSYSCLKLFCRRVLPKVTTQWHCPHLCSENNTLLVNKVHFKISATESRKDWIKLRRFSTACVLIITLNLQGNSVVLNTRVCLFQLQTLGERWATPACHHIDSCAVICALISSKWPRRALWEALGCFYWSVGEQHVLDLCFKQGERAAFKRIMSGRLSFYCLLTSVSKTNTFFCLHDVVPSHSHSVFCLVLDPDLDTRATV